MSEIECGDPTVSPTVPLDGAATPPWEWNKDDVVDGVAAGADISAENGSLNDDGNDGTDNADAGYDAYAEVVS